MFQSSVLGRQGGEYFILYRKILHFMFGYVLCFIWVVEIIFLLRMGCIWAYVHVLYIGLCNPCIYMLSSAWDCICSNVMANACICTCDCITFGLNCLVFLLLVMCVCVCVCVRACLVLKLLCVCMFGTNTSVGTYIQPLGYIQPPTYTSVFGLHPYEFTCSAW